MKNHKSFLCFTAIIFAVAFLVSPFAEAWQTFLFSIVLHNAAAQVFYGIVPGAMSQTLGFAEYSDIPVRSPSRALLDYLKKHKYPDQKVTQGYLKLFALLGTTASLKFNVIDDANSTPVVGERRLPRSDSFWADEFGFFIGKIASGASVGTFEEETFPNPYVFTNAAELAALKGLYNGNLTIEIADMLYFQALDLKRFEYADLAQKGTEFSAGATGILTKSSFNPMTGMYPCTPNIQTSGSSTPKVFIDLPESVAMGGTAGTTNYAVIYLRGFYIPDGAELGGKKK